MKFVLIEINSIISDVGILLSSNEVKSNLILHVVRLNWKGIFYEGSFWINVRTHYIGGGKIILDNILTSLPLLQSVGTYEVFTIVNSLHCLGLNN